mmetsp:Transcript_39571/g.85358  ORF Transcript_39571/g.85358 Transcript_39571/m.85358 type:complete len:228 (-) Transcript_39571:658-1341(-)
MRQLSWKRDSDLRHHLQCLSLINLFLFLPLLHNPNVLSINAPPHPLLDIVRVDAVITSDFQLSIWPPQRAHGALAHLKRPLPFPPVHRPHNTVSMPLPILPRPLIVTSILQRHLPTPVRSRVAPLPLVHPPVLEVMRPHPKTTSVLPPSFVLVAVSIVHGSVSVGLAIDPLSVVLATVFPCDSATAMGFTEVIEKTLVHAPSVFRHADALSSRFALATGGRHRRILR